MTSSTATSDATTRLTPAVVRVLEWHRRMYSATHPRRSPENLGDEDGGKDGDEERGDEECAPHTAAAKLSAAATRTQR